MKTGTKKWVATVLWSVLYLLFFSWIEWWYFLPFVILIPDAYFTKIIPWKKIGKLVKLDGRYGHFFEWTIAIIVALCLTVVLRTLLIEPYKIPTPSMEKTLLVGDYLFVSKIAYGPKLPNTPLAAPFFPNLLPNGKVSYSKAIQKPYKRLRGLSKVKRNDIIVFNFPEGDTVVVQYSGQNYYSLLRRYGRDYLLRNYDIIVHPVDMRDNYIKRCVGLPGDTLRIKDGKVIVNGEIVPEYGNQQFKYYVRTARNILPDSVLEHLGLPLSDIDYNPSNSIHTIPITNEDLDYVKELPYVKSIQRYVEPRISFRNTDVFPHDLKYRWTIDNFGSVIIPSNGLEIQLNKENIDIYKRIIKVYEGNKLDIINGEIYINDVLSRSYTFKMDYYFVLGDNRHNSADSRYWGFVPEDHLVGKAVWIWFSKEPGKSIFQGLRLNRIFKSIK